MYNHMTDKEVRRFFKSWPVDMEGVVKFVGDAIEKNENDKASEWVMVLKNEKNYTGKGYKVIGDMEREAIRLVAKYEGVLLDPVYTGRAMGGLINMIRNGDKAGRA